MFNKYAILKITICHLFIDCYNNRKIKRIDITDKADDICSSHDNYPLEREYFIKILKRIEAW